MFKYSSFSLPKSVFVEIKEKLSEGKKKVKRLDCFVFETCQKALLADEWNFKLQIREKESEIRRYSLSKDFQDPEEFQGFFEEGFYWKTS